jgi:hypothetical protein
LEGEGLIAALTCLLYLLGCLCNASLTKIMISAVSMFGEALNEKNMLAIGYQEEG